MPSMIRTDPQSIRRFFSSSQVLHRPAIVAVVVFLFLFPCLAAANETSLAEEIRSDFQTGRYEAGVKTLAEFRKKYGNSSLLPELELIQAQSCRNSFDAQKQYSQFADKHAAHPLAPAALIDSARLYWLMGDSASAVRQARRVRDQYQSSKYDDSACLILADANAGSGQYAAAANEYAALLALHPNSPLKAKAMLGLADAKYQLGELDQSRDFYNKILDLKTSDADHSRVYYSLAQIAENKGERFFAVRLYKSITEKMPGSFYENAAKERLKELGDKEDVTANRGDLRAPITPSEEYSVLVGAFEPAAVDAETAPYSKAGFRFTTRPGPEGKTEILIGVFSTKIQADFFAQELEKKFNRPMTVVKVK